MRTRLHGLAALALVLGLVGAACSSGSSSSSGGESPSAEPSASASAEGGSKVSIGGEEANNHGSKDVSSESEVDLEADDFYFSPTILTGSPGQELKIDVENEGNATHNFSITEQSVDQDIAPGEKQEVEVTFPQSGELVFFCKFHRSSGMLGELTTS